MIQLRLSVGIAISSFAIGVQAQTFTRSYQAPLNDSVWVVSETSPIQCRIDHIIPQYGTASFTSKASKDINVDFILDSYRKVAKTQEVVLRSVPPTWKSGNPVKPINDLRFYQQFDGYVNDQSAWQMLSELEAGYSPTFYFKDWYAKNTSTSVGLSSINFRNTYSEFLSCLNRLLPYSFDDISFTVLNYQSNSDALTVRSKQRLRMIGEYVKHDPRIDVVVIQAHTDSYGGRWTNLELSKKRADSIKTFLEEAGLDSGVIEVDGFGETRHIAQNNTASSRQTNRRVVISLGKAVL
ncbi:OmpA family protein [Alginatibacterium sediminis]|uniref:OmpA family protein n=1 Tax=Alginatibacterium sediminis TaxID=2164068 RepID=A0A420EIS3_9ALTE|nr:OmpA family protein [Alginatibacterium sediminis]RKF20466.1 OmpA family protein [Alginatibacterium sediminis]